MHVLCQLFEYEGHNIIEIFCYCLCSHVRDFTELYNKPRNEMHVRFCVRPQITFLSMKCRILLFFVHGRHKFEIVIVYSLKRKTVIVGFIFVPYSFVQTVILQ